jgi:SAM-dependent methyltransferase
MQLIDQPHLVAAPASNGLGFPMHSYIAAWKVYRAHSDEDDRIAAELSSIINRCVPRPGRILDIGPGDGRVILKALIQLQYRPALVELFEPNPSFARETAARLSFYRFADEVNLRQEPFQTGLQGSGSAFDVILCTHSLYFLSEQEFAGLLSYARAGARLVIVVDHETSLFSELWRITAPEYLDVVKGYLSQIRSLSPNDLSFKETFIEANLKDPFHLRKEMRDLVLSLLCYSDFEEELADDVILPVIRRRSQGGQLKCLSSCFEIAPPGQL